MTAPPQQRATQVTLDFQVERDGARIIWRSPLIGREITTFATPYDEVELPTVIRALDVVQHPNYPIPNNTAETKYFRFDDQERELLTALGLWKDDRVATNAYQVVGSAIYMGLGASGQNILKTLRSASLAQQLTTSYALRFPRDAIGLAALPWEALWDDANNQAVFIHGSTIDSLERYIDVDMTIPPPLPAGQQLHLLALVPSYGLPKEIRQAERAARLKTWDKLKAEGKIVYDEIAPLTIASLNNYLLDAPTRPDVVHYVGACIYRDGKGYLLFDDDQGGRELVSAERLAAMFGDVRLMVVHAYQSTTSNDTGGLLSGGAPALSAVLGPVVALQTRVPMPEATRFFQVFYDQLLGKSLALQDAVARGRQILFTEATGGAPWYAPTLYIRSHATEPLYLIQKEAAEADDKAHNERLLKIYQRNLQTLELQAATYGGSSSAPLAILNQIEDTRAHIADLERTLAGTGEAAEAPPEEAAQAPLAERWQRAAYRQRSSDDGLPMGAQVPVIPELREFVADLCNLLDFQLVEGSAYNYHNRFVIYRVTAPTLHLNLPTAFLIILFLEVEASEEMIEELPAVLGADEPDNPMLLAAIDDIADVPGLLGVAMDFGLVLVPGPERTIQRMINAQIRPTLKSDLIVLGASFLNDVVSPSIRPQTALLSAILREVELTRVSPFMAGGAELADRMFFGREGELKDIAEAVTKTSVAITCGRRIGKTSLLNRLARRQLPGRGHPCFFLNCQPAKNYQELLAEMSKQWERSDLPFDPQQPNSFAQVAQALAGANGRPPVFLLDEIDALVRHDSEQDYPLFKQLRALSMDGRARFVITGERLVYAQTNDANSPLFNFFGLKERLSFLTRPSVSKLIVDPLQDMQVELREPLPTLDAIFEITSGHPYLVQRLCHALVKQCSLLGVRVIEQQHIEEVLNDSDFQQDYFYTVWGQAPVLARIITLLLPSQGASMSGMRAMLRERGVDPPLRELQEALNLLDLYSVIERKQGGRYVFVATGFPTMIERAYGEDVDIQIELLCEEYQ